MKYDLYAFLFTIIIWVAWAFMEATFKQKSQGTNFTKMIMKALVSSWYVIVGIWNLYCYYMWSVYDHNPWPFNLIEKLK